MYLEGKVKLNDYLIFPLNIYKKNVDLLLQN